RERGPGVAGEWSPPGDRLRPPPARGQESKPRRSAKSPGWGMAETEPRRWRGVSAGGADRAAERPARKKGGPLAQMGGDVADDAPERRVLRQRRAAVDHRVDREPAREPAAQERDVLTHEPHQRLGEVVGT